MNKFLATLLIVLSAIGSIYGQGEGNIWYFGEFAGIDFNSGAPIALQDGKLNTNEGCAAISDPRGNLLFYTDGIHVWNKNHEEMPNGNNMFGDPSSTQSGVIVPNPSNSNKYYIFTVANEAGINGLRYSEVDMTMDNGKGDVSRKNVPLYTRSTEKITAVFHRNEIDFWVITHGWENNTFYAHRVTKTGVSKTPVKTNIGSTHGGPVDNAIGQLTASSNGAKVALATFSMGKVELFDFDNTTGKVSSLVALPSEGYEYGVAFSGDNSKLYVTTWREGSTNKIIQFDLSSNDAAKIKASKTIIHSSKQSYGSLQLGTDGKIYVTRNGTEYLGVIKNPNEKGTACGFVDRGFHLEGKQAKGGLPTIIQSFFIPPEIQYTATCFGDETKFLLSKTINIDKIEWEFGDPASGGSNKSSEFEPTHQFTKPGTYNVQLIASFRNQSEVIKKTIVIDPLPEFPFDENNVVACKGETVNLDATLKDAAATYRWNNGRTTPKLPVTVSGDYTIEALSNGCLNKQTVNVTFENPPTLSLGNDITNCVGETVELDATVNYDGATYEWSNGSTEAIVTISESGDYSVNVSAGSCKISDRVKVAFEAPPTVSLGDDKLACEGESVEIGIAPIAGAKYSWSNGNTLATQKITEAGTYELTVSKGSCTAADVIDVAFDTKPISTLENSYTSCEDKPISLDATVDGDATYKWSSGESVATISKQVAGNYTATITQGACSIEVSTAITFDKLPKLELGEPVTACIGDPVNLDATTTLTGAKYAWSNGATTPKLDVTEAGEYTVSVTAGSCALEDAITINFDDKPIINLGEDRSTCATESITLDATNDGATYSWSTGASSATLSPTSSGNYSVTVSKGTCSTNAAVTITVDQMPEFTTLPTEAITKCAGEQVQLDASTSIAGTQYKWSNGSAAARIDVIESGEFEVVATNGACETSQSVNVTFDDKPALELGDNLTECTGTPVTIETGIESATYKWNTGATSASIMPVESGEYSVEVTKGACTVSDQVSVTFDTPPTFTLEENITACEGESVVLDATAQQGATYSWNGDSKKPTFEVSTEGTYNIVVTLGACVVEQNTEVKFIPLPTVELGEDQIRCEGDAVTLDPKTTGNATFNWSTAATTPTIEATKTGTYSVEVTEGNCKNSGEVKLTFESSPEINLGEDQTVCEGTPVTLDASSAGTNATYTWSNGASDAKIDISESGTYKVDISLGTCAISDEITVSFDAKPIVNIGTDSTLCTGDALTLSADAGPNANYAWSTGATTAQISPTSTGKYEVVVTKGKCEVTDDINITFNEVPTVSLGDDQTLCEGTPLKLEANSPTKNVTYQWSMGATDKAVDITESGVYAVTVSLGNCIADAQVAINFDPKPSIDLGSDSTLCEGESIALTANGGSNASYAWSTGATSSSINPTTSGTYEVVVTAGSCEVKDEVEIIFEKVPTVQLGDDQRVCEDKEVELAPIVSDKRVTYAWSTGSTEEFLAVSASGEYSLTISLGSCSASDQVAVAFDEKPSINLGSDSTLCEGEVANISVDVPSDATVQWSTGANSNNVTIDKSGAYTVTVTKGACIVEDQIAFNFEPKPTLELGEDIKKCEQQSVKLDASEAGKNANFVWSNGVTAAVIDIESSGTYAVTASVGACTVSDQVQVQFDAIPVQALGADTALCAGSPITLRANGSEVATYQWSDGSTSATISPSQSGDYAVTVVDGACVAEASRKITFDQMPTVELGNDISSCEGETIELDASGPSKNAQFSWSNGATTDKIQVRTSATYTVTIVEGACTLTDNVAVDFINMPQVYIGNDTTVCEDQSFTLDASVAGNVTYKWQDESTSPTILVEGPGPYMVTVYQGECRSKAAIEVSFDQKPTNFTLGDDVILCEGNPKSWAAENNDMTFVWNDGSTDDTKNFSISGTYSVTATLGTCVLNDEINIEFVAAPQINLGPSDTAICEGSTIAFDVTTDRATYLWDHGSAEPTYSTDFAGEYAVTVSIGACETSDVINISLDEPFLVDLGEDIQACEQEPVTIGDEVKGATYLWSIGATSATINPTETGEYKVTATRGACIEEKSITVSFDKMPILELGEDQSYCASETVIIDVAQDDVTYDWNTGATTPTLNVTETGEYEVEISRGKCSIKDAITVTLDEVPALELGEAKTACIGTSIDLDASQFEGKDYTYSWNTGATTSQTSVTEAGTYTLEITNGKCKVTDEVVVSFQEKPNVSLGNDTTYCASENTITLTAEVPNATYSWQDGATTGNYTVSQAGDYAVTVTAGDCVVEDQISISFDEMPIVGSLRDTSLCLGDATLNVDLTQPNTAFTWNDGSTEGTRTITTSGTFEVTLTKGACTATESASIQFDEPPFVDLGEPSIRLCEGETKAFDLEYSDATYLWSDGSKEPSFTISVEGTYALTVTQGACSREDQIEVLYDQMPEFTLGPDTVLCVGERLTLRAPSVQNGFSNNGGGDDDIIIVSKAGDYWVPIVNGVCKKFDTINVQYNEPPVVNLGPDTALCEGETKTLDVSNPGATYQWSTGATSASIEATERGEYTVEVSLGACTTTDAVNVLFDPKPIITLGDDIRLCKGEEATIELSLDKATKTPKIQWNNGVSSPSFTTKESGKYIVTVQRGACSSQDSIGVMVDSLAQLNLPADTTVCNDGTFALKAGQPFNATYAWSDGSTADSLKPTEKGKYSVTVTSGVCEATADTRIAFDAPVTAELPDDTTLCEGQEILFETIQKKVTVTWQDGVVAKERMLSVPGTYTVEVVRGVCSAKGSIVLNYDVPPSINLSENTILCEGESTTLNVDQPQATYLWSDGSTGSNLEVSENGEYNVTVSRGVCEVIGKTQVEIKPLPTFELGENQIACEGTVLTIDAKSNIGETYSWNNGASTEEISVSEGGLYAVEVKSEFCSKSDSITITYDTKPIVNLGSDTTLCNVTTYQLNGATTNTVENPQYAWSNGAASANVEVTTAGEYGLTVTNGACVTEHSVAVAFNVLERKLGADTTLCANQTLQLDVAQNDATYNWNTGSSKSSIDIESEGTYAVEITRGNCSITDEIIVAIENPIANLGNTDTTLCNDDVLTLNVGQDRAKYKWSTGATDATIQVSAPGSYEVEVSIGACTAKDQIDVDYIVLDAELGGDTTLCVGQPLILQPKQSSKAATTAIEYAWSDGSSEPSLNVTSSGTYSVELSSKACSVKDEVTVAVEDIPLNLGNDTTLCNKDELLLIPAIGDYTYAWQDQTYTSSYTVRAPGAYWVHLQSKNGCSKMDTINVTYDELAINLPKDTMLCPKVDSLEINLGDLPRGTDVTWNTGSNEPVLYAYAGNMYELTVNTKGGCTIKEKINILEKQDCPTPLYIPIAFSPNDDKYNTDFKCLGDIEQFDIKIYDRKGRLVYASTDIDQTWDGTFEGDDLPIDSYVYILEYADYYNVRHKTNGTVTLLR